MGDFVSESRLSEASDIEGWLTHFGKGGEVLQRACCFYLDCQSWWKTRRKCGLCLVPQITNGIDAGYLHIDPHAVRKISWLRRLEDPVISFGSSLP